MQTMKIMSILQATNLLVLVRFVSHMTSAEDDTPCLEQFYKSVKDPNKYLSNWDFTNSSVCSFTGVQCWNTQENKVLSLTIEQAGLSGPFPSGLNTCASITSLSLAGNAFSGSIPSTICDQVQYVTALDLSDNSFTGSIPDTLANCVYLKELHLEKNKLSGSIPWAIGLLPKLTDVDLSSNSLNGTIPSSFTNFSAAAFQNNPGLCGHPLDNSCGSSSKSKESSSTSSNSKELYVGIAVGVVVFIILLLVFQTMGVCKKRQWTSL